MAAFDTHRAVKTLVGAGFSETKAEAMVDAMGESHETLATKADIEALRLELQALERVLDDRATKTDLAAVHARLDALEQAVGECASKADLREQELRLRLQLYAVAVIVIGVLATLEFLPR